MQLGEVVNGPSGQPITVFAGSARLEMLQPGMVAGVWWPTSDRERLAWFIEHGADGMALMGLGGTPDVHFLDTAGWFAMQQGNRKIVAPERSRAALARAVRSIGRVAARRAGGGTPDGAA